MSARSIVLSAPMVRAILAGTKTQARRVVRWPVLGPSDGRKRRVYGPGDVAEVSATKRLCPHGAPGDLLWVRETWAYYGGDEYLYQREPGAVAYRAAYDEDTRIPIHMRLIGYVPGGRWRPSVHMPRWASRLTLRMTSVRVERLHAITEEDARAEGFGPQWAANPWVWVLGFERVEAAP